jgi:ketosteroid isomerase-like protein
MDTDDDITQLRELEATIVAAFNNKDVDTLMSVYARAESLFVFDVVGPPGFNSGWDAYREAFTHMFAAISGPLTFTMSNLHIDVSGDVAYSRSLQRVSGVRTDGKTFAYTVRATDVYRKIDGKWLIVQEHVSLPIDRKTFAPMFDMSIANAESSE